MLALVAALGGTAAAGPDATTSAISKKKVREVGTAGQPRFQNGWTNVGGGNSTAAFYRDPLGVVHLKGTFETGNDNTVAFTLPTGYRASRTLNMPAFPGTGHPAQLIIRPNGNVFGDCISVATCIVGIDGLTFRAG